MINSSTHTQLLLNDAHDATLIVDWDGHGKL
uniref:Uncharacterized protein n=1 Tax=Arundo donax TaxID=35708 RepID=A0A0A8Y9A8_ARUDO